MWDSKWIWEKKIEFLDNEAQIKAKNNSNACLKMVQKAKMHPKNGANLI